MQHSWKLVTVHMQEPAAKAGDAPGVQALQTHEPLLENCHAKCADSLVMHGMDT